MTQIPPVPQPEPGTPVNQGFLAGDAFSRRTALKGAALAGGALLVAPAISTFAAPPAAASGTPLRTAVVNLFSGTGTTYSSVTFSNPQAASLLVITVCINSESAIAAPPGFTLLESAIAASGPATSVATFVLSDPTVADYTFTFSGTAPTGVTAVGTMFGSATTVEASGDYTFSTTSTLTAASISVTAGPPARGVLLVAVNRAAAWFAPDEPAGFDAWATLGLNSGTPTSVSHSILFPPPTTDVVIPAVDVTSTTAANGAAAMFSIY